MELKEFIKNVLEDVTGAVKESENGNFSFYLNDSLDQGIDFDLAVVLKKSTDGRIGAEVFSVLGAKAKKGTSEEKVNRIKFKVIPSSKEGTASATII